EDGIRDPLVTGVQTCALPILDEPDPAQVDRGEEAGRVAESATADGDDDLASIDPESREFAGGRLDDPEALGRLALRKEDRGDLRSEERRVGNESASRSGPSRH